MDKTKAKGTVIPNKLYFRIGEVSEIVDVKPYVLRYWESEFPDIKPSKSKSGQRLYKRRDVEMLVRIKELLYEEKFTINGAKKRLKDGVRSEMRESAREEAVYEAEKSAPRQLDVFERAAPVAKKETAPHLQSNPNVRDGSKTLIKIRRDLESILEVVRS